MRRAALAVVVAVTAAGCVRVSSAPPPDQGAADRALMSAQEMVEARSLAFRSIVTADDLADDWRVERDTDERTGADADVVDRVVRACTVSPAEVVSVTSNTYVRTTATEDALVATQDSARSFATVYADADEAATAFAAYAEDGWVGCVAGGLKEAGGEANIVDLAGQPLPGVRADRTTTGARFAAVFDVDGKPVGVFLDLIVLRRDRVVGVLELSAVNRPFGDDVRADILDGVGGRLGTEPTG